MSGVSSFSTTRTGIAEGAGLTPSPSGQGAAPHAARGSGQSPLVISVPVRAAPGQHRACAHWAFAPVWGRYAPEDSSPRDVAHLAIRTARFGETDSYGKTRVGHGGDRLRRPPSHRSTDRGRPRGAGDDAQP